MKKQSLKLLLNKLTLENKSQNLYKPDFRAGAMIVVQSFFDKQVASIGYSRIFNMIDCSVYLISVGFSLDERIQSAYAVVFFLSSIRSAFSDLFAVKSPLSGEPLRSLALILSQS